ncbi:MAG: glutamyl-tRNA reductase [Cytophagaceae bacterium]|nr:glutamyl-tRNA reductase [Cytophagaceae bacterium]
MISNFKLISLSYKKAPVSIREKMALSEQECKDLMLRIKDAFEAHELLVLSTCNRTEVYYAAAENLSEGIIKLMVAQKGLANSEEMIPLFEVFNDHEDAIVHLFRVGIGLESQVLGDAQITNQVKHAYQWSADQNMAGPFIHRLLHTIFFTNKKVVQETQFRDGAASVSYATVELAEELLENYNNPNILIIGVGEMGADVARNMMNSSLKNVFITNRTEAKAQAIAEECGFTFLPFDQLQAGVIKADLVISSVALPEPLIKKSDLEQLTVITYKYFVDISVPRSIAPDVEQIPGVILYGIDTLQNRSQEAIEKRHRSIPHVESIIETAVEELREWSKEMVVSPTIQKLKNALEQIRKEEISRHLKSLNVDEAKRVDEITRNMMQKIIKLPVLQLKAACKRGEAETLIDVLNDLFNLEKETEDHSA